MTMFDILCQTAKAYDAAIRGERESMERCPECGAIAGSLCNVYGHIKPQWPTIAEQQAHWQAKDEAEAEALREQREREQLADMEAQEEADRQHVREISYDQYQIDGGD